MGTSNSKIGKKKIKSYNDIKVPEGYKLFKLCSFNINLRNTVNNEKKIKSILNYLDESYKDLNFDIVCFQGIHDDSSLLNLIRAIKSFIETNDNKLYYAPDITIPDYDDSNSLNHKNGTALLSSKKIFSEFNISSKFNISRKSSKKITATHNIIISKYPIVTTLFAELDDSTEFDDIVGIQTVIGVNILINNKIISIYNTELCKDIKIANIINDTVRYLELEGLFQIININKDIKKKDLSQYEINDLNFIVGTFNINEMLNGNINEEYKFFIQNFHCFDIFRYKNLHDLGYTNSLKERVDYILLVLSDNIYDENTPLNNEFRKISNDKELYNFIHKQYKIYFIDIVVRQGFDHISKSNFPLELVFMLKI
jgi:hypothetical protein